MFGFDEEVDIVFGGVFDDLFFDIDEVLEDEMIDDEGKFFENFFGG